MKKFLKWLSVGLSFAVIMVAFLGCNRGGDGVTTCKNCGKKEVVLLGFCERCYESFHDYTYGE